LQKKNCQVTGFDIEELEVGDYYGFHLDGDHLYMTSDFIVHHNSGKSIVISDFVRDIFRYFPNQRIMMLTHVWKLILQNKEKMEMFWPNAPIGIHSAGLGLRDVIMPIIFGGVQSVAPTLEKNPKAFGHRDLLLIDEAHLLSAEEDSQYLSIIKILKSINPLLKVIGFTATPYRLKMGSLTDGGIFTDICYNICTHEWFQRLINEGYLSPLIGRPTDTKIHGLEKLRVGLGEVNQSEAESIIDTEEITYSACKELLEFGYDRNKCMIFAAGIDNAEHINNMMESFGASFTVVHSKLSKATIRERMLDYENDEYWGIIGANQLTTGYDNPRIDIIGDFQLTKSPGKHVQKLGRGTRVFKGNQFHPPKLNTLVLDFVGNIYNNGPIDDPIMPRKPGVKTGDPPPIKFCETIRLESNQKRLEEMRNTGHVDLNDAELTKGCGAYNHASSRYCCNCAAEFSFKVTLYATARNDSPMKQEETPQIELVKIKPPIFYSKHQKKPSISGIVATPTAKVTYTVGMRPVNVFLCFEHTGRPRHTAREWWRLHSANEPPNTIDEFLSRTNELRIPKEVRVHINKQYPSIEGYSF
jgi:DNA repair protein RadD